MLRTQSTNRRIDRAYTRLAVIAVLLLGLLVAYVGVVRLAYGNRIYPGVTLLGLDLGGLTVSQATAQLNARIAFYQHRPIEVNAGDWRLTTTSDDLGYRPGAELLARAAFAEGRGGDLIDRLTGPLLAHDLSSGPPTGWDVDELVLDRAVQDLARRVDQPTQDATLIIGAKVTTRPARVGVTLDQSGARDQIRAYLSGLSGGPLTLPVRTTNPRVSDEQVARLKDQADAILSQPVRLAAGQKHWTIPVGIVRQALVYQDDPPALTIRTGTLAGLVQSVSMGVDQSPRNAAIAISSGQVKIVPDASGARVDQAATLTSIDQAILAGHHTVDARIVTIAPSVKASDLANLAKEAQAVLDRGLTLTADNAEYHLSGTQLGDLIVVKPGATDWSGLTLDPARLRKAVADINGQFRRPQTSTRFDWNNGKVSFLGPSRAGWVIDQNRAVAAVSAHWREGKVDLPVVASSTALDDGYVAKLQADLKAVLQERATSYAGSIPERAHNIALAAQRLNGAVVPPGALFSFNQTVGPTTLAAGYQWGFAFTTDPQGQSRTVPSVAGGLCQVATTVFQPVFWAGYQIEERHWHMFVMQHYADNGYLGLDATVAPEDGLDFQFTNNSDHALLIQSWTDNQQIHVRLVGTPPDWKVQVDPEQISDRIPAPTQVLQTTSSLFGKGRTIVLEEAQGGLTSRVTRRVVYPDGHVRTLNLKSIYQPSNASILVGTG